MAIKDFRDALYYMTTKELVPKKDTERISRVSDIILASGLAGLVGTALVSLTIAMGPREAFNSFVEGSRCASLNYGGNYR